MKFYDPLLDFCRLQGSTQTLIGWITPTPSQISSLLALSHSDGTNKVSGLIAFRSQVFSTSQQKLRPRLLVSLFHLTSTCRVLVYKAWPWFDQQLFPAVILLRCYRLYMVFFRKLLVVPTTWPPDLRHARSWLFSAPGCKQLVSILSFGQPWSFNPVSECLLQHQVSSLYCDYSSLDLFILRGIWLRCPGLLLPLSGFCDLLEYFCSWSWFLRLAESSPHEFFAFQSQLLIRIYAVRDYWFSSG